MRWWVHGGQDFGVQNNIAISTVDFALTSDLGIANTFYKKSEYHLVTFASGHNISNLLFSCDET